MIVLKNLAAPLVLLLTLAVAVLSFLRSLITWVLGILALIAAICGLFACTIGGDPAAGIQMLIMAFLFLPLGSRPWPSGSFSSWMTSTIPCVALSPTDTSGQFVPR